MKSESPWGFAKAYCEHLNASLVLVNTEDKLTELWEALHEELISIGAKNPWVSSRQKEGSPEPDQGWTWTDGSPVNMDWFSYGEPNDTVDENCLEIYLQDSRFNDKNCNIPRPILCETKKGTGKTE